MKKTRFLVLALAVAIMLMGAGYAWWSEQVTVTTTVNSGVLDVDVVSTDGTLHSQYVNVSFNPAVNVADPNDTDALAITIDNLYPDAYGWAKVCIKNTGSIPVKMDKNADVASIEGDLTSPDRVNIAMEAYINDSDLNPIQLFPEVRGGYTYYRPNSDITANVGDTITIWVKAALGFNDTDSEKKTVILTLNPVFEQFNKH